MTTNKTRFLGPRSYVLTYMPGHTQTGPLHPPCTTWTYSARLHHPFCKGWSGRWNILQRCQEEGFHLTPLQWALTSAWLEIDTPTPVFNRLLNIHIPRPPWNDVSSLFLYDHVHKPMSWSVYNTSNGGTDGTAYRPTILTSSQARYLSALVPFVILARSRSPPFDVTPQHPASDPMDPHPRQPYISRSRGIPLPPFSFFLFPFPFSHTSSPFASPDKTGKQGNRAYMQVLLPGRCKSSAESYGLSPTPLPFQNKPRTMQQMPTVFASRRKGACFFPLVCCAAGI